MARGHSSGGDFGAGGSGAHVTHIPVTGDDSANHRITIPDTEFLLSARFTRAGSDLVLTGDDGHGIVLSGYFDHATRLDLVSPGGALLTGDVVAKLTLSQTPGQYAQAGAPAGAAVIGHVERLGGHATVQHANGVVEELKVGDKVLQGDVVETGGGSQIGMSFNDGTAFNMGANARMVLSELVYDAGGSSNSAVFSLVKGSISFVAGQVAKTGDMRVETPVATMGIRGTSVNTNISTDVNGNTVSVTYSLMADPDGHIGSFNILDRTTGAIIGTISTTDTTFVVTPSANLDFLATQTDKTPDQIAQELAVAQVLFPIFLANPANFNSPNVTPQDTSPKSGSVGSSGPFGGSQQNLPDPPIQNHDPAPHTGDPPPPPPPPPANNGAPDSHTGIDPTTGAPVTTVVLHTNSPPSIFADPNPPHLKEAAGHNPGVATSLAHLFVTDVDGNSTVSYDTVALLAAGWTLVSTGVYAKDGRYGTATLDTVANTLTYTLDNTKADPLGPNDHPVETFTIPVCDDEGATASTTVGFTIDGANDAPKFVGGHIAVVQVAENMTAVTTVHAIDPDSPVLTYSIVYGLLSPDASKFQIDPLTGELSFRTPPDYEHPTDPFHRNVYTVQVRVSDGFASDIQTIFVKVTNVNEAPHLSSQSIASVLNYTEDSAPLQLMADGLITDPDHPSAFTNGSIHVDLDHAMTGDELELAGNSHVNVSGGTVFVDHVAIGTVDGNHTDHLTVNFNSTATEARVEQVLHAVSFESTSSAPTSVDRTATVTFNDGGNSGSGGALSDSAVIHIHVTPAPDVPHAVRDVVITNVTSGNYFIPEWALLANDTDPAHAALDIAGIPSSSGFSHIHLQSGGVLIDDDRSPGGSFDYLLSNGSATDVGHVTVARVSGTMNGGPGNEIFIANSHGSTINAGSGDDILISNGGNDTLNGGPGNDIYGFSVLRGHDTIRDSGGNDTIRIDTGGAVLTTLNFAESHGDDLVINANGLQITVADHFSGSNNVESLIFVGGSSYAGYALDGTYSLSNDGGINRTGSATGNSIIVGDSHNNHLTGGAGNDLLFGGAGNDTLIAGTGNDLLVGGGGADTFVFGPNFGHDVIADFTRFDTVEIDGSLFSSVHDMLYHHTTADVSGNAVITTVAGDTITFNGVSVSQLQALANDFHFVSGGVHTT